MKTNDFALSLFDLRYTRFGASGREGAPICDIRHSTSATAMGPRKTVKTIRQTYSACQSGKKIVRMGGVTSPPTYIREFWSLQRRIARRKSDRHSFPIELVPSFTASTLSKLTNVQIEHCRLRRKRLLGLLEQFNRHRTTFSHPLLSGLNDGSQVPTTEALEARPCPPLLKCGHRCAASCEGYDEREASEGCVCLH